MSLNSLKRLPFFYLVLILVGQTALVGSLLWLMSGRVFPFTTDSIVYISTAEQIANFKGLLFTNLFVQPPFPDLLPLSIWPPGFPICIAMLKWMGVNEFGAAIFFPRICCLCLPFLFFSIFRKFISDKGALFVSGMCSLTFSVLSCSSIAWSDTPYLAISLLVLMMVINIFERKVTVHWSYIVLTGGLSGIAFLFRFIGVSLIGSIGISLVLWAILRLVTFKDFIRMTSFYALGVLIPVVPYCIRNLIVFGKMFVYLSGTPNPDFFRNVIVVVRLYFQGLSSMMLGTTSFSWLVVIFIACLFVIFLYYAKELIRDGQTKFACLLLLALYFFIQSFFLIYFRSSALLTSNPDVNERLLMQFFWILLGSGVYVLYCGVKQFWGLKVSRFSAVLFILLFVLVQISNSVEFFKSQTQIKNLARNISQYFPAKKIPADYLIVSNVPDITFLYANRNVRALADYTPLELISNLGAYRKFVVFLVKGCGYLSPAWEYRDDWKIPVKYYKVVYSDQKVDLLVPQAKLTSGGV